MPVKSTFLNIAHLRGCLLIVMSALAALPVMATGIRNDLHEEGPAKDPVPSLVNMSLSEYQEKVDGKTKKTTHHFLTGVKLGAVFVFGVELDYILKHKGRKVMYIAAAGQTSIVINTINGGGGFFVTNWGLGVGCRYNHVIRLYDENIRVGIPGYSPEVVWYKEMGLNRNWYINLRAATIITKEDFWPDVSFGIFLPLNK